MTCLKCYSNRTRLQAHLSGKKNLGSTCLSNLILRGAPKYSESELKEFGIEDAKRGLDLKKKGRAQKTAAGQPVHRFSGPIIIIQGPVGPEAYRSIADELV